MGALLNIIGAICSAASMGMLLVSVAARKETVVLVTGTALALIFALVALAMFMMGGSVGYR